MLLNSGKKVLFIFLAIGLFSIAISSNAEAASQAPQQDGVGVSDGRIVAGESGNISNGEKINNQAVGQNEGDGNVVGDNPVGLENEPAIGMTSIEPSVYEKIGIGILKFLEYLKLIPGAEGGGVDLQGLTSGATNGGIAGLGGQDLQSAAPSQVQPSAVADNASAQPGNSCNSTFEQEFLKLVNDYRKSKGLSELQYTESALKSARQKAEDMAKNGSMSHVSPTLGSFGSQMGSNGVGGLGENVAMSSPNASAQSVFNQWVTSPTHEANICNPMARFMGVGGSGGFYCMQLS